MCEGERDVLDGATEDQCKQWFRDIFLWVAEHRPEWLAEVIAQRKAELIAKGETIIDQVPG